MHQPQVRRLVMVVVGAAAVHGRGEVERGDSVGLGVVDGRALGGWERALVVGVPEPRCVWVRQTADDAPSQQRGIAATPSATYTLHLN